MNGPTPSSRPGREITLGLLLCWFLNIVQLALGLVFLATLAPKIHGLDTVNPVNALTVVLAGFPVIQLVYVIPLAWRYRRRIPHVAKGIVIAASISTVLSATCDYMFFGR